MTTIIDNGRFKIDRLELGPFGTNSYILTCRKTHESVVVDAPGEANRVVVQLEGTLPRHILITHDHFDHLGGLLELQSALKIPLAAHPANDLPVAIDLLLNDGDQISFGAIEMKVLHTPGHTQGSVCFLTGNHLIAGDTLFPGGPGRTQTPADFKQIVDSITQKLFELPDETQVFPGHGEATTIGRGKELFEIFSTQPHPPDLCGDVEWDPHSA